MSYCWRLSHISGMRKRDDKLRKDENEVAFGIVRAMIGEGPRPESPDEREKNPEAVLRGRKGGRKGGKARAEKMPSEERSRIAREAATVRWSKRKKGEG